MRQTVNSCSIVLLFLLIKNVHSYRTRPHSFPHEESISKQESPPSWTQEAYRLLHSRLGGGGVDRHTDTCQNITFPHHSDAGGKKMNGDSGYFIGFLRRKCGSTLIVITLSDTSDSRLSARYINQKSKIVSLNISITIKVDHFKFFYQITVYTFSIVNTRRIVFHLTNCSQLVNFVWLYVNVFRDTLEPFAYSETICDANAERKWQIFLSKFCSLPQMHEVGNQPRAPTENDNLGCSQEIRPFGN